MTAQEETELLLRVVTQLAEKLLAEGGFVPFGGTLGPGRYVKLIKPKSMKRDVTRDELEEYWVRELRRAVATGECKTVCHCTDVRIQEGETGFSPAVLVHVEHADAISEDILYPYRRDGLLGVVFGKPTRVATAHQVFASPWKPS
jgi:hypothetical protein